MAPGEITFTYEPYMATVALRYLNKSDDGAVLQERKLDGFFVSQAFTPAAPAAFNQGGRKYKLDGEPPAAKLAEGRNEVDVYYVDDGEENTQTTRVEYVGGGGGGGTTVVAGYTAATLSVQCVDAATGGLLFSHSVTAIVDRQETIKAPAIEGYALRAGEAATQAMTIKPGTNAVTFRYDRVQIKDDPVPQSVFTSDHIQFIQGYRDGTVRPDADITRAEVAMVIYRLLSDPGKGRQVASRFPDVPDGAWHAQAISYLASIGIVRGYEDGTFRPDDPITRAEFATLASGFAEVDAEAYRHLRLFGDVAAGSWHAGYVNAVAEAGWVAGYPDGTFMPDARITRAEAVTVVNRMVARGTAKEDFPAWAPSYPDLGVGHWGFAQIIEASIGHEYEPKGRDSERWLAPLAY
jgi:hypothetical protein